MEKQFKTYALTELSYEYQFEYDNIKYRVFYNGDETILQRLDKDELYWTLMGYSSDEVCVCDIEECLEEIDQGYNVTENRVRFINLFEKLLKSE